MIYRIVIFTIGVLTTQFSYSKPLACSTWTHCSAKCSRPDGSTSYGYFCMFGSVCNPLSHSCEKADPKIADEPDPSEVASEATLEERLLFLQNAAQEIGMSINLK